MKKILSTVAIVGTVSALALGLTACGDKTPEVEVEKTPDTVITETEKETEVEVPEVEVKEETTDENEEVVEEEATEEDVTEDEDSEEVTDETTDDNTEVEDEEEPTEDEDSKSEEEVIEPEEATVSIDDIVNTMKEAYGETYLPNMPLDEEMFTGMTGISKDLFTEFYAEVPMISAQVDKLFVLKAADGKVDELAEAVKAYNDNEIENGRNYPMNLPKLEKAVVEIKGDYVIFYMLGGYTDEMVEDEEENAKIQATYCDEQNEIGKKALDELFK